MSTLMDLVQKNFSGPQPLVPFDPSQPGQPPPARQLTAQEVVGRGAEPPPWPAPDTLPAVVAARQQLKDAEENLARLKKDIDQARAASATKAPDAADLARYLKEGKPPPRDQKAQQAGERAALLSGLLEEAQRAVDKARAAGAAAWAKVPEAVVSAIEAEWHAAVLSVGRTLAAAAVAQLHLRSLSDRYAAFWTKHRLAQRPAPLGLQQPGRPQRESVCTGLLHPEAARASNDVVRFLEALRGCGVLSYEPVDLRALDMTPAPHEALLRLDDILREVAGQLRPEPTPQPEQKGP
jgi:hypothetical protein